MDEFEVVEGRTARMSISTTGFVEESPKAVEIPEAQEDVSSVVVLRPLALRVLPKKKKEKEREKER